MKAPKYTPTPQDQAAARSIDKQSQLADTIWQQYGQPEAQRSLQQRQNVSAIGSNLSDFLGGGTNNLLAQQMGLGKTIAAPQLVQQQFNPQTAPTLGPSQSLASRPQGMTATPQTHSFLEGLKYLEQMKAAPDPSVVGQNYDRVMSTANMLGLDQGVRSAASASGADLAMRGIGGSSQAGTQSQALENWAARERAGMQAETMAERLKLEQALRGETNLLALAQLEAQQGVLGAENKRLMGDAEFANTLREQQLKDWWKGTEFENALQQQQLNDWWQQQQFQQALAAQENANRWGLTNWDAQQAAKSQQDHWNALNWLQADSLSQMSPYQAVGASGDAAKMQMDLANQQYQRWLNQVQQQQQMYGMLGGIFGSALGGGLFR